MLMCGLKAPGSVSQPSVENNAIITSLVHLAVALVLRCMLKLAVLRSDDMWICMQAGFSEHINSWQISLHCACRATQH